ncbi:MAG: branched-chain amino acid transport system ATP-binding protein [Gammaproteobacteria bacterium]|jgi:branched-chain amino acid transport system ATP-binding protein
MNNPHELDKNSGNDGAMLRLDGVSKYFSGFTAVNDVSFDVPRGAIAGLIGPNGAGKTTLFNTLAGQLENDAGQVFLDEQPIHGQPPHSIFANGLARTFQIPRPFPEMTVLENIMTVPGNQIGERFWNNWIRPGAVAREEITIRQKSEEVLDFCNLTGVRGDLAGTLSGGQLKLLELARALMSDPKIILLDEPAAGVNPSLMVSLVDRIVELNKRGFTFLIIEHNMELVMSLCDPVIVMAQGSVIYNGNAEGARKDPAVLEAYLGDLP